MATRCLQPQFPIAERGELKCVLAQALKTILPLSKYANKIRKKEKKPLIMGLGCIKPEINPSVYLFRLFLKIKTNRGRFWTITSNLKKGNILFCDWQSKSISYHPKINDNRKKIEEQRSKLFVLCLCFAESTQNEQAFLVNLNRCVLFLREIKYSTKCMHLFIMHFSCKYKHCFMPTKCTSYHLKKCLY